MTKSYRILIIEDERDTLEALHKFFTKQHFEVHSASNGLDALKILAEKFTAMDLIITDLILPNISGVGIISIVKKKYPHTPVIAITGWGEHPEALAAEAQADSVIRKPFNLDILKEEVVEILNRKDNE